MGSDNFFNDDNSTAGKNHNVYSYDRFSKDKPLEEAPLDSQQQKTPSRDVYSYDRFSNNNQNDTNRPEQARGQRPPQQGQPQRPRQNQMGNTQNSNPKSYGLGENYGVNQDSGEFPSRRRQPNKPLGEDSLNTNRTQDSRRPSNNRNGRRPARNTRDNDVNSFSPDNYQPDKMPPKPSKRREIDDDYYNYGRKKKKIRVFPIILLIVVLLAVAAVGIFYMSYNNSLKPIDPNDESTISFEIRDGATTNIVADDLESAGLISNANFFSMRTKKLGFDGKFKPGTFSLSKSMSTDIIIKTLSQLGGASSDIIKFTIPEGLTLEQTMYRLVDKELVTEEEFMDVVMNGEFDYEFMQYLPEGENRLEGFLYPETYEVYKGTDAYEIIDMMLAQFDSLVGPDSYERAAELNMNILEIVTMASLIERETMIDDERARVAGVIYNRLAIDMKLQIDATIQFILPEVKEHLTYDDLKVDSPYNTYQNKGLPPGPICSPRYASIEGALYPEDHDYIFYVLHESLNGTHNFSSNDKQFEKDKAKYKQAIQDRDN